MSRLLDEAVLAVIKEASARAVMPRYQQLEAHEVIDKSAGELVTVADREA